MKAEYAKVLAQLSVRMASLVGTNRPRKGAYGEVLVGPYINDKEIAYLAAVYDALLREAKDASVHCARSFLLREDIASVETSSWRLAMVAGNDGAYVLVSRRSPSLKFAFTSSAFLNKCSHHRRFFPRSGRASTSRASGGSPRSSSHL